MSSSSASPGLDAILTSAAFAPLDNVGWIRVTGEDRVRWLNGMATNSIQDLKAGEGCYNFFLNAQGRIQGDATAFVLEHGMALETAADRVPALMAMLDHFIIMDDVELADASKDGVGISVTGPRAEGILRGLGLLTDTMEPISLRTVRFEEQEVWLIRSYSPLAPSFELWCEMGQRSSLIAALVSNGAVAATAQDVEQLRILSGTPLYGVDIRAKDLPQETAQTRALHFAKGCYLGQEIVERIRSRGAVHRTFTGFTLTGSLPEAGAILSMDDKPIGEFTSVADTPFGKLALGYIRREALERGARIQYPGGVATPSTLPFPIPT